MAISKRNVCHGRQNRFKRKYRHKWVLAFDNSGIIEPTPPFFFPYDGFQELDRRVDVEESMKKSRLPRFPTFPTIAEADSLDLSQHFLLTRRRPADGFGFRIVIHQTLPIPARNSLMSHCFEPLSHRLSIAARRGVFLGLCLALMGVSTGVAQQATLQPTPPADQ